ncbi:MAG: HAD hydrolase family protein, partial [Pseudomonadales bacterium]
LLYDPAAKTIIESKSLPGAQAQQFVDAARLYGLHLELYSDTTYFSEQKTPYTDYHTSYLKASPEIFSLDSICQTTSLYKALLAAGTEAEKRAVEQFRQAFTNLRFYTGHGPDRPDIDFISVLDEKACKQRAFASLCEYHNVSAQEVMAIGDAQSDIAFIQLAGTGVAMGNASDEVKACADFITAHVDNDGLAIALDSLA